MMRVRTTALVASTAMLGALIAPVVPAATGLLTAAATPPPAPIETVGPIPTVDAGAGVTWPVLPVGLAQMPRGGVVNPQSPYLSVPALRRTAELPVRVVDISRELPIWSGTLTNGWTRIGATLTTAREYRVQVQQATGAWTTVGSFSVAPRGAGTGPSMASGGMTVSAVTGQVTAGWNSPTAIGPAGGASVSLSWGSNAVASVPGLPSGWSLSASTGAWARLTESTADETAVLQPGAPLAVRTPGSTTASLSLPYPAGANRQVRRWVVQRKVGSGPWRTVPVSGLRRGTASVTGRVAVPESGTVRVRVGIVAEETTVWGRAGLVVADAAAAPAAVSAPRALAGAGSRSLVTPGEQPATVRLTGWDGTQLTFTRNALGIYGQAGGAVAGYANALTWLAPGSWEFTDSDGGTTRFSAGRAVSFTAKGARAATYAWDGAGRLASVTNEIGRAITLRYAGSASCPSSGWTGSGFVTPPDGQLCGLDYPDGTATEIGYVAVGASAQIALLKDAGETGTSFGWDERGRLSATRSALVTSAAAEDPSLAGVVTRLTYDSLGRVAELVDAPAVVDGDSVRRTVTYPSITEGDLRDWDASPIEANAVTAKTITDARYPYAPMTTSYRLDPVSWRALSRIDPAGLRVSSNPGSALRSTTDQAGRVTSYTLDDLGQVTKVAGPVEPGEAGPRSSTLRDTTRTAAGDDKPLAGLRALVFARPDFLGSSKAQYLASDPNRGSLSATWSNRPAEFSGQAAGVWTPGDAADAAGHASGWRFLLSTAGGTDADLVVGGNLCAAGRECTVTGLPTGPKSVSVQVRRAGTSGWFQVLAAPVGQSLGIVPATEVGPGYGLTTVAATNDELPGAPVGGSETRYAFTDPASTTPSSVTAPGGLTTALAHEASATGSNDWGRLTSTTTPGGKVSATAYWDDNVDAALPDVCGGGTLRQSGQARSLTMTDGRVVQSWYDLRGQERASVSTGDGITQTLCTTYFDDGTVASTAAFLGADLMESTATTRVSALTTTVTTTHGPAAPVSPGATVSSSSTVDLLGRTVSSTDESGTATTTEYDVLGNITAQTTTPPDGAGSGPLALTSTYRADDGRLASVSVNGVLAASVLYDGATGRVSRVTYPDGIRAAFGWSPTGALGSVAIVTGSPELGTVSETRSLSAFGRVESSVARSNVTGGFRETRGYSYDAAGRLASSVVSTVNGPSPDSASYGYGYGAQSASCPAGYAAAGKDGLRTSGRINGAPYVVCHDARGRLASTTSPLVTGGSGAATATYDGLGRLLTLGGARPLSVTWGAGGIPAVLDEADGDGGHRITTTLDTFGGAVLDQTVTSDAGTSSVRLGGPFRLALTSGTVTGTASVQYALPGGATVTRTTGEQAALTLPGADGSALVTLPVPSLGSGTAVAPAIAGRFGPYGEPLVDVPTDSASPIPHYSWKAAARQQTLAGASSVTVLPLRAYAPLLGEFLSPDPVPDSASNLYAYTDGDPVNQNDPTGGSAQDTAMAAGITLAAVSALGGAWAGYAAGRYSLIGKMVGSIFAKMTPVLVGAGAAISAASQNADGTTIAAAGLVAALGSGLTNYSMYKVGVNRQAILLEARRAATARAKADKALADGRRYQAQVQARDRQKVEKLTARGLYSAKFVKDEQAMAFAASDRAVKNNLEFKFGVSNPIKEERLSARSSVGSSHSSSGTLADDLNSMAGYGSD